MAHMTALRHGRQSHVTLRETGMLVGPYIDDVEQFASGGEKRRWGRTVILDRPAPQSRESGTVE